MTHTLIIETQDEKDFELIKGLANRLGLPVSERHVEKLEEKQRAAFKNVVGSWAGDETGDELADRIRSSRSDTPRNIEL